MIFDILTIFPGMFESPLRESIMGKAIERGLVKARLYNIRDYATDKHQMTDDRPFGGGEGMVMKPEPIVSALDELKREEPKPWVVLLSPQGRLFSQDVAWQLSRMERLVLICGRYEGVDERVADHFTDDVISIGDYVLTGGELAAMVVIDAVTRLIPGVLGNEASASVESFAEPLLEYPQYTRPREFQGHRVPDVLLSGNHEVIHRWRRGQALLRTKLHRPDLFARLKPAPDDLKLLKAAEEAFFKDQSGRSEDIFDVHESSSTLCGSGALPCFESKG
jgi:tRNA (guanine37-N1)-methyltransferase